MTCLVFDDISAAECALALQDTVKGIDLARVGLSGLRGMRVAAHAAPVFDGWDPVAGTRLYFGTGVTQTARSRTTSELSRQPRDTAPCSSTACGPVARQ